MNNENDKLEVFLKYFNEETVQKNKHMSAVLKKNLWFLNIITQIKNFISFYSTKNIDDIFDFII